MEPFAEEPATGDYGVSADPSEGVGEVIVPPRRPLRRRRIPAATVRASIRSAPNANMARPDSSEARPLTDRNGREMVEENPRGPWPKAIQWNGAAKRRRAGTI